jgi:hypothetical protein
MTMALMAHHPSRCDEAGGSDCDAVGLEGAESSFGTKT